MSLTYDDDQTENKRKVNFSFTVNNYRQTDVDAIGEFARKYCSYLIIGREHGQETKTPHLQGHCDLLNACTLITMQRRFAELGIKKCPIFIIKKNAKASRLYCRKDGDFTEYGTMPEQGKRNDLVSFRDDAKQHPTMNIDHLLDHHLSVFARNQNFVRSVLNHYQRFDTLDWKEPPNMWVWGPPGVGKSRRFQSLSPRPYLKLLNRWWDGYDGQPDVLIEDVCPESCKYLTRYFKIWCDRYPFLAEIKGSSQMIRPQRILITSNYHPDDIFIGPCRDAMLRRLNVECIQRTVA